MSRLLFLSNGHGEDSIGGQLIDGLRELAEGDLAIEAWPMVGAGQAYSSRGIPVRGPLNLLPSQGFATLSLPLLVRDLRAGWVGTHVRQLRGARALRGRFDLAVAIGDVVPTTAAELAGLPFIFVGCAKSEYYGRGYGYTRFELAQLRRRCLLAFPRDLRTTRALSSGGVSARYVGNPMMDGLEDRGTMPGVPERAIVLGCLPGSRLDAVDNALSMLRILSAVRDVASSESGESPGLAGHAPAARDVHALFAVAAGFNVRDLGNRVAGGAASAWRVDSRPPRAATAPLRLVDGEGLTAEIVSGQLANVLRRSTVVLGTAGTANEQAIGLGKPLVTFATDGPQGRAYLAMKMRYFGEAALEVPRDPPSAARMIWDLLGDPDRQARMATAGRERMGEPGATVAIAHAILAVLESGRTDEKQAAGA